MVLYCEITILEVQPITQNAHNQCIVIACPLSSSMGAGDGFRAPVAVITAGLLSVLGLSWFWSLLALLGVYSCSGGWRFLYVAACTIKRDLV